jgi:NDP-sugar pyrophosphorylase family protein
MVTPELREIFEREENAYIVELPNITEGAACTALTALGICGRYEPVIVAACDQIVDIPIDDFIDYAWAHDGCLMTFKDEDLSHSFCVVKDGTVTRVVEKPSKKVSDDSNVGIYWFKDEEELEIFTKILIANNNRINGEFYIAPIFNELISERLDVVNYDVPKEKVHLIGTPKDLERYVNDISRRT